MDMPRYLIDLVWFGLVWFSLQYGLFDPVRSVCVVPDTLWWSSSSSILWSKSTSTVCSTLCLSLTLSPPFHQRREHFRETKRKRDPFDLTEKILFREGRMQTISKASSAVSSFRCSSVCFLSFFLSEFYNLWSVSLR